MSPCGKHSACRHVYILVKKMLAVRGWKPWGEGITKAGQAAAVRLVAWKIAATGHSGLSLRRGRGIPRQRDLNWMVILQRMTSSQPQGWKVISRLRRWREASKVDRDSLAVQSAGRNCPREGWGTPTLNEKYAIC